MCATEERSGSRKLQAESELRESFRAIYGSSRQSLELQSRAKYHGMRNTETTGRPSHHNISRDSMQ